jgi:PAS domain S-box-containing protein
LKTDEQPNLTGSIAATDGVNNVHSSGQRTSRANGYLYTLSRLAGRSFASTEEAIRATLRLITQNLGMRTSLLTRVVADEGRAEVIAVESEPGGCGAFPPSLELSDRECRWIAGGVRPKPVVVMDTQAEPGAIAPIACMGSMPARSYLSVPIVLSDGSLYGFICALDPEPRHLEAEQEELLVILARLLATQIERDQELVRRQRIEESLRVSEARFRAIVQHASDFIVVYAADGSILYLSPSVERALGYTPADVIASQGEGLVHPEDADRRAAIFQEVAQRPGLSGPFELRYRHRNGEIRWFEVLANNCLDDPVVEGIVVYARDITERKRAEAEAAAALEAQRAANAELERLNRIKSEFIAVVSHEFRTPLTGILGFSELLAEGNFSPEEVREFAEEIRTSARRLTRLINDLLDLERMQSGRITMHFEPVDLNTLIAEVTESFRTTSDKHRIVLELDPAVPMIRGDRDRLVQVLTNLLSNSIKYSPSGGVIRIISERVGTEVRVGVQDQGIGIPPEALAKIFEPYFRAGGREARGIEGAGLGLAIARQIVKFHGGRIWAESIPGHGSTFWLTLPIPADIPKPAAQ